MRIRLVNHFSQLTILLLALSLSIAGCRREQAKPQLDPALVPVLSEVSDDNPSPEEVEAAIREKPFDAKKVAKEKLDASKNAYEIAWAQFKPFDLTKGDGEKVYRWSRRWMESQRNMAKNKTEKLAAAKAHFDRMQRLEDDVQNYARGTIPFQQMEATRFYRAEAEVWLAEEKSK